MAKFMFSLACFASFLLCFSTLSSRKIIEHTFYIQSVIENKLCKDQAITVVNGSFPGPTIYAEEGDTLIIHVINESPYDMTIHWHGVLQQLNCWADGAGYITQCPIRPGRSFTYKFKVSGQEGTLWWHAHTGFHRATVHGALIIYPKNGRSYPFPKPDEEVPILIGRNYDDNNGSACDVLWVIYGPAGLKFLGVPGRKFLKVPQNRRNMNAYLSSTVKQMEPGTFKLKVTHGKTYLLRIINAALDPHFFLTIANHKLIVVATDASYTNPYHTNVLVLVPGQTYDVLLVADQKPQQYYMATQLHRTSTDEIPNITPSTALLIYENSPNSPPTFPELPDIYDISTTFNFINGLKSLDTGPFWEPVLTEVDEHMFLTVNLCQYPCETPEKCGRLPNGMRLVATLNSEAFVLPTKLALLHAFYYNIDGVYEDDFPNQPPVEFDYTNCDFNRDDCFEKQSTKLRRVKFNTTLEIVFQGTSCFKGETHAMHLHGYNFYVLGQGFGNYNATKYASQLNLVNPVVRNTVDVLANGWVVVRFRADNPGVWYIHCHNEGHVPLGMATAFIVEDGPTLSTKLSPPPSDLPEC